MSAVPLRNPVRLGKVGGFEPPPGLDALSAVAGQAGSALVLVGVVGAPHGVRGDLRVKSYTAEPASIGRYGPLSSADGRARFDLVDLRTLKDDIVVARFKGVATREAAAALTGTRLYLPRAALPEAGEDEFYHADLIGLAAELPDGTLLGRVEAVQGFGAGDLLLLAREGRDTVLVPFTKLFVPVVDLAGRRVVVMPEALAEGGDAADGAAPDGAA